MTKADIRNPRSEGKVKQKICAYIKMDDGREVLEFKDGGRMKRILVPDFIEEVKKAHIMALR